MKRTRPAEERLAAVYVRVSSRARDDDEGEAERQANSYDEQKSSAEEYIKREGLTAAEGYVFHERESASKPGDLRVKDGRIEIDAAREKWIKLVELLLAADCPVRILVVQTSDRLSRNHVDDQLIEELIHRGVEIHFLREGIVVNRANWERERFRLRARQMISGEEGAIRSDRVAAGRRAKARKGHHPGSRLPIGLRWKAIVGSRRGKNREVEIDPATGPKIAELFRLADTGRYGAAELWRTGGEMGLWDASKGHSPIRRLFSNPAYIGGYRWTPPDSDKMVDVYEGNGPKLVEPEVFFRVQEILAAKKRTTRPRGKRRVYMLSGTMECSRCGKRLSPNGMKNGDVYWRCTRPPGGCGRSLPEKVVIQLIAEQLDQLSLAPEQAELYAEQLTSFLKKKVPVPTASIDTELATVEKNIARYRRRVVDEDLDDTTLAVVKEKLSAALTNEKQLRADKEAAEATVVHLRTDIETARRLLTQGTLMGQRWLGMDEKKQRALLDRVLALTTRSSPELPIAVDFGERSLALSFRPAWETIRRLARGAAQAARAASAEKPVLGPASPPPRAPTVKPLAIQM